MNILSAVIIDDEEHIRNFLRNQLGQLFPQNVLVVGEAYSVDTAVGLIAEKNPDIAFIDIDLGMGTGFEVLRILEEMFVRLPAIVFISGYTAFTQKAFDVGARDYIVKPITPTVLKIKVERLVESINAKVVKHKAELQKLPFAIFQDRILIPVGNRKDFVHIDSIKFIEGERSQSKIICKEEKEYIMSHTLQDFELAFAERHFVRVHKSYVVNFACVESVFTRERQMFLKIGDKDIPVGDAYRKKLP
jgi:two-component system LytT family response regulator